MLLAKFASCAPLSQDLHMALLTIHWLSVLWTDPLKVVFSYRSSWGWGLDMYAIYMYNKGGKRTNSSFIVSNLGLMLDILSYIPF